MSVESLAQLGLEQLPSRSMRQAVDEHDVIRQLPLRQFFRQELEEHGFCRLPSLAGMHDQQRTLLPDRMLDRDDSGLEHLGVRHGEVLDLDRGNPLAAGLDDILQPVGKLDVTIGINRANVTRAKPAILVYDLATLALEIA